MWMQLLHKALLRILQLRLFKVQENILEVLKVKRILQRRKDTDQGRKN